MNVFMRNFFEIRRDRQGVTSIEYALLGSVIAAAMFPWLYILGAEIETPFLVVYDTLAHIRPF